ncbi:MAG: methyl-accepting chemotaxis protein [Rhodospirillaceae bacterium]
MDFTVKAKLRLAFLGLGVLFIGFGLLANERMGLLNQRSAEMAVNWIPSMVQTAAINKEFNQYVIETAMHILTTEDNAMVAREKRMGDLEQDIARRRSLYEPLINSDEEARTYKDFSARYDDFISKQKAIRLVSRKNQTKQAFDMLKATEPEYKEISILLDRLVTINQSGAIDESNISAEIFIKTRYAVLGGIAGVVLIALWLAVTLERAVSHPIAVLSAEVERVAAGDLQVVVAGTGRRDEVGMIARSVASTVGSLQNLIGELRGLIGEARAGNLSVRARAGELKGEYRELLAGANELLEVLGQPLSEVAQVMQRVASGDLKGRMTGTYEGDLRALQVNVNRSLDGLAALLTELGTLAAGMASGDLRRTLEGNYNGEFAALKANFNQAGSKLRESLGTLGAGTVQVSAAVTQTTAAARQVAEATAGQMAALGEIAATVAQTAASVNELSVHAETGNGLARITADLALDGRQKLERLAREIEQIAERQGSIDRITAAITRIADKTQVLSINAGMEAVRVGEQGRGFGVVAHQIGRLAEEAAVAARDIGLLIDEAGQGIQRTVGGVDQACQTMNRIAEAATSAGAAATTIAAAIAEQASAVQSLAQRSDDIRRSSDNNAAAVEEISVTMEELARMAHQTRAEMARFVLA